MSWRDEYWLNRVLVQRTFIALIGLTMVGCSRPSDGARPEFDQAQPQAKGQQTLKLLPPGLVLPAEGPPDFVRNAVQMLLLAEQRAETLPIPPDRELAGLLRGAEALLFKALFAMERAAP
jgi:hypothetical protein